MSLNEAAVREVLQLNRVSVASSGLSTDEEIDPDHQCPICLVRIRPRIRIHANAIACSLHNSFKCAQSRLQETQATCSNLQVHMMRFSTAVCALLGVPIVWVEDACQKQCTTNSTTAC